MTGDWCWAPHLMLTGAGAGAGVGAVEGACWCGALSQLPVTTQHSEIRTAGSLGLGSTESSKTSRLEKQEIEHRCCAFM